MTGLFLRSLAAAAVLVSASAAAAPGRAAVSDQQMLGIVRAIAGHDAGQLRNWVGERVFFTEHVGDFERKSPESLVETFRPCIDRKIVRFTGDPDIFVLWDCPNSPWKGPTSQRPGFSTMLTNRPEGLTLVYSLEGFPTGATPAPPVIPFPKPERG